MSEETRRVNESIIAAWNTHDVQRSLENVADNATWHDVASPEPMRDKTAIAGYIQGWFTAFPDIKITIDNQVISGEDVATELTWVGTNSGPLATPAGDLPPTGKRVMGKGTYFGKIRNGKVVEVRTYPDIAGMMMQLGVMPV